MTNSEDTDEMPQDAAFHKGLHWLPRQNCSSEKEIQYFIGTYNLCIYNGPSQVYCIKSEGRIHWNTNGLYKQLFGLQSGPASDLGLHCLPMSHRKDARLLKQFKAQKVVLRYVNLFYIASAKCLITMQE